MSLTNRRMPSGIGLVIGLALSQAGLANPVQCAYGALTRNIEVVYSDPGQPVPCEVIYNKSMESSVETLWRAHSKAGYCEAQAEALIDKLRNFGWRCEPIAGTAVHLPAELPVEMLIEDATSEHARPADSMERLGYGASDDAPAADSDVPAYTRRRDSPDP
jgi:hypothetical protein